jgi:hypothetical protein
MDQLVLHPRTIEELLVLKNNPTHAVALVGVRGSGKRTLAEQVIATALAIELEKLTQHPYYLQINPDETTISIEQIRDLQHFTQLKTIGSAPIRRAIIVLGAGNMTIEAQNAFLKLLEEPPADTMIVLTVENERSLLPTIMSRVRPVQVRQAPEEHIRTHFTQKFDKTAVDKAFFLSGGLPGLMQALLRDEQAHPLVPAVTTAKEILQKPTFDRLLLVDDLSKKKDEAKYVLQALRQIAEAGMHAASKQQDAVKIARWHTVITAVYEAEKAFGSNGNAKIILTNLMLAL